MGVVRRQARRVLAIAIVLTLYGLARLPSLPEAERADLARRFDFSAHALPEGPGDLTRRLRPVHPSLRRHAGWISSVGAAVALADLDADGLPNDCVWVDTRTDRVIAAPVPGTGSRYAPFDLDPAPLPADETTAPMGAVPGDFNEDGRLDVLVYYWGRTPVAFLRRPGPALEAAAFAPVDVAPGGERWYTNAATTADVDGDGHVDLVFGNYFQDDARILDPDADGRESMQDSMSRALNGGRNRLLLWAGAAGGDAPDVRYRPVDDAFDESARAWTLAIGAADLDGDLRPELYFANDFGSDRLLHNRSRPGAVRLVPLRGRKRFDAPNSKVLGRDSFKGMGVDFGDLDDDGVPDIYVSNIADEYALEESHFAWVSDGPPGLMAEGIAPYTDRSEPLGLSRSSWGWESRLADFDNDGVLEAIQATGFLKGRIDRWPELHELAMGNDALVRHGGAWPSFAPGDDLSGHAHNPFFVRGASGRYFDLAPDLGLDEPYVTRGIATADVDGDGDLDYAIGNQWERSLFYRNDRADDGRVFLGLNLVLPTGGDPGDVAVRPGHPRPGDGRPAIGAAVTVRRPDGGRLVGQVDGGNGHSGVRSPQLHFGLGVVADDTPVRVEVRWRDATGAPRSASLELTPGWHTLVLGSGPAGGDAP
jgi:hypothetical protein